MSHHEELIKIFEELIKESKDKPVRVSDVLARIHADGFSLICIVHTLPFLQPMSLGPISTVAGTSLMGLGGQMWKGLDTPWLPKKMANMALSEKTWRILLRTCERVLNICKKLARPRLTRLASGPRARKIGGMVIALSGLLLAIPLAGVPFSNTIPALAVLFVCVAELEEDGFFMIAAFAALILTLLYFGFLGWVAFAAAGHAWDWLKPGI